MKITVTERLESKYKAIQKRIEIEAETLTSGALEFAHQIHRELSKIEFTETAKTEDIANGN